MAGAEKNDEQHVGELEKGGPLSEKRRGDINGGLDKLRYRGPQQQHGIPTDDNDCDPRWNQVDRRKRYESGSQEELIRKGIQERAEPSPLIRGARDSPVQRIGQSRHEQDDQRLIKALVHQQPNVHGDQQNAENSETVGDIHASMRSVGTLER